MADATEQRRRRLRDRFGEASRQLARAKGA